MKTIKEKQIEYDCIIFCDTICFLNNEIIEKANDEQHCLEIITKLNNKTHEVLTCMHIILKDSNNQLFESTSLESTFVTFCDIPEISIKEYCKTTYPYNKAGAYAIQDIGASFIKQINGCFGNVIGLPVNKFCIEFINLMKQAKWI